MAKLAVINRQAKREAMVKKFAERRKQLLAIIRDDFCCTGLFSASTMAFHNAPVV